MTAPLGGKSNAIEVVIIVVDIELQLILEEVRKLHEFQDLDKWFNSWPTRRSRDEQTTHYRFYIYKA